MAISSAAAPCRPAALAPNFRICFWAEATALAMVYSGTLTAPDSTRWANPTAMPEETPTPSKACSLIERRRLRSVFIELASDQIEHRHEGLLSIAPAHRHFDFVAKPGGEHHQSHDRAAVGDELAPAHLDIGFVLVRQFDEFGRRASMQAALIADGGRAGERRRRIHRQLPASASS